MKKQMSISVVFQFVLSFFSTTNIAAEKKALPAITKAAKIEV